MMDLRDSMRHIHPTTETVSLSSSVVAPPTANPDRLVHGRNGGGRDGWGGGGAGGSGEHVIGECEGNAGGSGGWGGGCGHRGRSGGRGGGGRGGRGRGGGGTSGGGGGGGGRGGRGRGGGGTSGGDMEKAVERNGELGSSHIESNHRGDITDVHSSQDNGSKVRVSGKRRVCRTLKATPAGVVKRSISNLAGEAQNMFEIKRKYKKLPNNRIRWWHILTGNEDELVSLEKKWEAVKVQTGWKIEPCYVHETFLINGQQPVT